MSEAERSGGVPRPRRQPDGGRRRRRPGRPAGRAAARWRPDPPLVGDHARDARRPGLAGVLRRPARARRQRVGDRRRLHPRRAVRRRARDHPHVRRAARARRRVARWHLVPRRDRRAPRPGRGAGAGARRRRAAHRGGRPRPHRRVHGRAHGGRVRIARRGRRRDPAVQPAPPASDEPRRPREEPAQARRRPLVLALGPGVHLGQARRPGRDALVARRPGAPPGRGALRSPCRRCSCAGA